MNCPNEPAKCRCVQHHPGLSQYATNPAAYLVALHNTTRERTTRLQAVPVRETQNTYRGDQPQPWEPKPPRHLRDAA